LTFLNVTINDAQVIQCNISNKHGYNFTNAYMNVHRNGQYDGECSVSAL